MEISEKSPPGNRFLGYIVLNLLGKEKGSIFCKTCKKEYPSRKLQSASVGFGKNPLRVNIKEKGGIIKKLFGKRVRMKMMESERNLCPKDHKLISMIIPG